MTTLKNNSKNQFSLWKDVAGGLFKIIFSSFLFLISFISTAQKEPIAVDEGFKVEIKTSAICEMCQYTLEKDMAFEKGVKEATLNLDDKVMSIVYNPKKTDAQTLRKRITMIGYHADTLARSNEAYEKLPMCCKDGSHGTPVPQLPIQGKDGNR